MKVLLTGGAGFVGSNIAKMLEGNDITIIDNLKTGYLKNVPSHCKFVHMDCTKALELCDDYDVIIHVAGQASKEGSFEDVFYDLNANATSTLSLLELSRKVNCKRFIFISTVCVYGGTHNPGQYTEDSEMVFDSFYSIHKHTSEQYLKLYKKHYGIDYTIFRLFTCYGPAQDLTNPKKGMVSIFLNQFLNSNEYVTVKGSLDRYRDFVYVGDVARIVKNSIYDVSFFNEIVNVGTGVKTTVGTLLETMNNVGNFQKKFIIENEVIGDMFGCYADNTKLKDFPFTTLDSGLRLMIESELNK